MMDTTFQGIMKKSFYLQKKLDGEFDAELDTEWLLFADETFPLPLPLPFNILIGVTVTLVLGLILGLAGELTADFPRPLPLFVFFSSVSSSKSLSSPSLALSSLLNSSLSSKSLS